MYGEPLHVNGLKSREITALVEKTLRRMLAELKAKG
jgi:hypothetical protein